METLSLDISSLDDKDSEQMITLVSHLDGNELIDNSTPLVHHVLEPSTIRSIPISERYYENTHCLICNAKFGISGRGSIHIFSNEIKTTARHLELSIFLSNIVERELDESNTHSSTICKKCFKFLDDIDSVEGQLNGMKQEVSNKFFQTQALIEHEKNSMDAVAKEIKPSESPPIAKDDKEFKITSKVRPKKSKRGRGRGRPPSNSCVKLEVKEESDENVLCFEFIDTGVVETEFCNQSNLENIGNDNLSSVVQTEILNEETGEEVNISLEDVFEVDGLDLNNEENTIQIGGMVVPTISNQVISKEMFSQSSNEAFHDNKIPKYKCRFCHIKMFSFTEIQSHLIQFHPDRLFECEVCEERTDSQSQLLEHLEQHLVSGEKPYTCRLCPRRYALPRQLKEHIRHHLSKTISCYQCPKRFKSESALQEHMNTHTGYRPYSCEQCDKKFSSKHILKAHTRTHTDRNRPHKCKVCQKHFLTANHLNDHLQIHQNRKDFICETCGKGFGTQRSLDLHSITHSGIKNFNCSICLKPFARKGEVEDHERIHTGEKPFQCEICGATFSQRSNLQSHKRATHYEEKKYQCAECNKAFKRRRLLVYHVMSVHTGERPHKCSFCNSAFVYPEHYKKHLRIHTGEKPFKCEICGKAFNSRDNKNSHKFIHSEKKQYECGLCGVGFMRKPQMLSHIQGHNPTENIESYIKVNSSSVVDAELIESRSMPNSGLEVKVEEEQSVESNIEHMQLVRPVGENGTVEVVPRQIQIANSDDVQRYYIHKSGEKTDDSVGHILASLQGQVVEIRADDLERYTELTADQISQMAQVAAQVVATQNNGSTNAQLSAESSDFSLFQIQLDEDKDQSDCQTTSETVITAEPSSSLSTSDQSKEVSHILISRPNDDGYKKIGANLGHVRRQVRTWNRSNEDYVEDS